MYFYKIYIHFNPVINGNLFFFTQVPLFQNNTAILKKLAVLRFIYEYLLPEQAAASKVLMKYHLLYNKNGSKYKRPSSNKNRSINKEIRIMEKVFL